MLHLVTVTTFGAWSPNDVLQMHRKQFIWKTAKGLMCYFTTAHVSPEYSRADMIVHCADGVSNNAQMRKYAA